ncbi:MAG: hypothetical protein ACYCZ0_05155 [Minisyncoccota bacterium]
MKKFNKEVAERIQREMERVGVGDMPEGVQPLNPGYFMLERIRALGAPKQRSAVRGQLNRGAG